MYQIHDFGRRLAEMRKEAGFTQETVAARLNVSPQAVSKWENESCYPDITLLPSLATLLGVGVEKLFGYENETETMDLPPSHDDLPLVHTHGSVGCYSSKAVANINHDTVVFTDGSRANLHEQRVWNEGAGEVQFLFNDRQRPQICTKTGFVFEESIRDVKITAICGDYTVRVADGETTVIQAKGSRDLIAGLSARVKDGMLQLEHKQHERTNVKGELEVDIALAAGAHEKVEYHVNGSADIRSDVAFAHLNIHINGSGDITHSLECQTANIHINGSGDVKMAQSSERLLIRINGSGDVTGAGRVDTDVAVNGSGDVTLNRVTGCLKTQINGSGDIKVKSGEIDDFTVKISGSGDVDARGVVAQRADLFVEDSGTVVIGQVIGESKERHGRHSKISVIKRGL